MNILGVLKAFYEIYVFMMRQKLYIAEKRT